MGKAARAIITVNNHLLVMHRNKYGSEYYTLVGGQVHDGETIEQALVREVKEESGLDITSHRLVFHEKHPAPYNEQFIFLCEIAEAEFVAIQEGSEEEVLNRYAMNTHRLSWVSIEALPGLQFRTPQLQAALIDAFKNGFPSTPRQVF